MCIVGVHQLWPLAVKPLLKSLRVNEDWRVAAELDVPILQQFTIAAPEIAPSIEILLSDPLRINAMLANRNVLLQAA